MIDRDGMIPSISWFEIRTYIGTDTYLTHSKLSLKKKKKNWNFPDFVEIVNLDVGIWIYRDHVICSHILLKLPII